MCWSATADLVAGGAIAAVGVACVVRVRRPGDLPLAALPLLLGAHQIVEAQVWRAGGGAGPATTAWAVVALPVLPLLLPVAVLLAAPPIARPRLVLPLAAGLATASELARGLATGTVTADPRGHTLGYVIGLPHVPVLLAGYLIAAAGSLLLSGDRVLRRLGVLVAVGAAVCGALWRTEFVSTWCAFAAVVSVVLLHWVRRRDPGRTAVRPR